MESTLHVGDRVLVNKWSYRLHDVHRGDVVVFTKPKDEPASNINDLIKRVIGLPGETVTIANNHVYINGHQLNEPYLDAGAVSVAVPGTWACTPQAPCKIPKGQVWVMGDNRTDSEDSRYFGPIPESSVVGRAFFRIWPLNRIGTSGPAISAGCLGIRGTGELLRSLAASASSRSCSQASIRRSTWSL